MGGDTCVSVICPHYVPVESPYPLVTVVSKKKDLFTFIGRDGPIEQSRRVPGCQSGGFAAS